ncbi:MAG: hypothetical protein ACJ760_11515 [Thermoleophilaceae bacterium]
MSAHDRHRDLGRRRPGTEHDDRAADGRERRGPERPAPDRRRPRDAGREDAAGGRDRRFPRPGRRDRRRGQR